MNPRSLQSTKPWHPDFAAIRWPDWNPRDRATLLFVVQDGRILLIHKKRGLGQGKINGPGGRLETGETPLQCAVREVQEELLIDATDPRERGTLSFQFADGYSLFCTVFTATAFTGTPTETPEARPEWFPVDAIPYDRMWADDALWLPHMLNGHNFHGRFLFDRDAMLGYDLEFDPTHP
jgi:8-oxo-dGTP diphosphatase